MSEPGFENAFKCYQRASEPGFPEGDFQMAALYKTNAFEAIDYSEALKYYKKKLVFYLEIHALKRYMQNLGLKKTR